MPNISHAMPNIEHVCADQYVQTSSQILSYVHQDIAPSLITWRKHCTLLLSICCTRGLRSCVNKQLGDSPLHRGDLLVRIILGAPGLYTPIEYIILAPGLYTHTSWVHSTCPWLIYSHQVHCKGHGLYTPAPRTLNLAGWLIHRKVPLKLIHRLAHFVCKPDYIEQNWLRI